MFNLQTSKQKIWRELSVLYSLVLKSVVEATDSLLLEGIYNPLSRASQSVGTGSAALVGFWHRSTAETSLLKRTGKLCSYGTYQNDRLTFFTE